MAKSKLFMGNCAKVGSLRCLLVTWLLYIGLLVCLLVGRVVDIS